MVGDLRPGQKLIETDLCQELGVSRASLREALRALESERLVDLVPNRGPSVAKLGEKEIEEIHVVWALLTGEAVYDFAQLASSKDVTHLQEIVTQLNRALRAKNPLQQLNVTNSFFGYIYVRCNNDILVDIVSELVSRLNFLRAQSLMHEGWRELCAQEIKAIMKAIVAKAPGKARQAMRRHIELACDAAMKVAQMPKRDTRRSEDDANVARLVAMERWTRASETPAG